jgi:hypothetical protein
VVSGPSTTGSDLRRIRSRPASSLILFVLETVAAVGTPVRVGRKILAAFWAAERKLCPALRADIDVVF